jgi:hypothetical protein
MRIVRVYPDYDTLRISRRKIPLSPSRGEFGMTSLLKYVWRVSYPFNSLCRSMGRGLKSGRSAATEVWDYELIGLGDARSQGVGRDANEVVLMRIVRVYPDYDTLRISRRKIPLSPSRGEFGMTSLLIRRALVRAMLGE